MKKHLAYLMPLSLCAAASFLFNQSPESGEKPRLQVGLPAKKASNSKPVPFSFKPSTPEEKARFKSNIKVPKKADILTFINEYGNDDSRLSSEKIEEGIKIAKRRVRWLKSLASVDPQFVIDQSLPLDKWLEAPEEVRAHLEKPFASSAEYEVFPICSEERKLKGIPMDVDSHRVYEGQQVLVSGKRLNTSSKEELPSFGVQLDDMIVLSEAPLKKLQVSEVEAAKEMFKVSPRGLGVDPISGTQASPNFVALYGDTLHGFASQENMDLLSAALSYTESKVGDAQKQIIAAINGETGVISVDNLESLADVAASLWSESNKSILYIRVNLTDKPTAAYTKSEVETILGQVSGHMEEMSYDKTRFSSVEATSQVFTLANASSHYVNLEAGDDISGSNAIKTEARALAQAAGYVLGNYDIVGVIFPSINIGYGGRASVGNGASHWINGPVSNKTISHEFGHNYGIIHANFWSTTDGSVMGTGSHVEYGDIFDIMGVGSYPNGHFSAHGKHRLNWIPDSKVITTATSGQTYRIYRQDHRDADDNPNLAMKISNANSETFYVSYRKNFTSNSELSNGLYIQWDHDGENPRLLDMTPDSSGNSYNDKLDAALALGSTFIDPTGNVYITPIQVGGTAPNEWIDVLIGANGNTNPTGDFSFSAANARQTMNFTSVANDSDGDTVTMNWDFGDGSANSSDLNPTHRYSVGGNYTVVLTLNDGNGGVVNVEKQVVVADPLTNFTPVSISGLSNVFTAVASNGNVIVGVDNAKLVRIQDLSTYTDYSASNQYFDDVTYFNGFFYAVGLRYNFGISDWQGIVMRSADGSTWQDVHVHGSGFYRISRNSSKLIVGGRNGEISTSTNGTTWSNSSIPGTTFLRSVAINGSNALAFNTNRTLYRSSNGGSSWSLATFPDTIYSSSSVVKWVNDRFFFCGAYAMYYSVDGATWTECSLPANLGNGSFYTIKDGNLEYKDGLYLGELANLDDSDQNWMLVSEDGVNFSAVEHTSTLNIENFLIYGDKIWIQEEDGTMKVTDLVTNTAPVANAQSIITSQGIAKVFTLSGSDGDGDPLTYNVSNPSNGVLSGTAPNLTYTPSANFTGQDSFSFTVNDGTVDSASATVTIEVGGVQTVDFSSAPIQVYSPGQDGGGVATVHDSGGELRIVGNGWKRIAFPYNVTKDTILEFEFRSDVQAEIQGIGFDNDDVLSSNTSFQLYGTQTWGMQNYRDYTGSGWKTYRIRVGDYFTGSFTHLVFPMDHDGGARNGESFFKNVKVLEDATGVKSVNFSLKPVLVYDSRQDGGATATVHDAGKELQIKGNGWKRIALPYNVTADTILEFEFKSAVQGEIHGIGFDNDDRTTSATNFQLYGSDSYGISNYKNYSGSNWKSYRIRVGDHFTGAFSHLVFPMDHDGGSRDGESFFKNIRVYEEGQVEDVLSFAAAEITPYDSRQDGGAVASVHTQGSEFRIKGNGWKKIALPYNVTADTILEFEFKSEVQGEIHGIGFDNDDFTTSATNFQLYGTQNYGFSNFNNYSGTNWKSYQIRVGDYFTGSFTHLVFPMDHDGGARDGESYFRNVKIYEENQAEGVVDFASAEISAYDSRQDGGAVVSVHTRGEELRIKGNGWKKIELPYTVTANTILEFDFKSGVQGEIHGIGFDNDDLTTSATNFQLYGTQNYGFSNFNNYSGTNWKSYQIRVGDYFTGSFTYLVFPMDHDGGAKDGESFFRNVKVYEEVVASLPSELASNPSSLEQEGTSSNGVRLASSLVELMPGTNSVEEESVSSNGDNVASIVNESNNRGLGVIDNTRPTGGAITLELKGYDVVTDLDLGVYKVIYERPRNYLDKGYDYQVLGADNDEVKWQAIRGLKPNITKLDAETEEVSYTIPFILDLHRFKVKSNDANVDRDTKGL